MSGEILSSLLLDIYTHEIGLTESRYGISFTVAICSRRVFWRQRI